MTMPQDRPPKPEELVGALDRRLACRVCRVFPFLLL